MECGNFYQNLPKIELHAHLNGSLSSATLLQLKRFHADSGLLDKTNAFVDEFFIGVGDTRSLSDCFQVFGIAHALTSVPEAVALATSLTLKEFEEDGCCYIELRSTPRQTENMTRRQYIDAIIKSVQECSRHYAIICKLIISIDRKSIFTTKEITNLAIEFHNTHPDIVLGLELSGDPTIGKFQDFVPYLKQARAAGLKITLHCGEVANEQEILQMLDFKPERIGHGVCTHPRLGGSIKTWQKLCHLKIPVEICLTSNVNTKLVPDYKLHHFQELSEANIPVIICTDDKGVFSTSLSQEYQLCAETFNLTRSQVAHLALMASNHIFFEEGKKTIRQKISTFMKEYELQMG